MQFSAKKKITFSFLILAFLIFCFLILNKALNEDKIYSPKLEKNKNSYLPDFNLPQLFSSDQVLLSEIVKQKDFSLVNIWASWCIPCRDEHIFLMTLKKNEKIEIIGLNYKDKEKNAKKFLNELGNPYNKILSDPDGTISIEWGAYGVPESFLIHKDKVIKKIIGPLNDSSFKEIERLVK